MPYSENKELIWVPIPLNAHRSLYHTLKPVKGIISGMPDTFCGGAAFKRMYSEQWSTYRSFAVIRDPVDRFISAVRRLIAFDDRPASVPANLQDVAKIVRDAENIHAEIPFLLDILAGKKKKDIHPWFLPQVAFLCAGIDDIVPITQITRYIANVTGRALRHDNAISRSEFSRTGKENEALIKEHYAKDYKAFEKIPVWPSDNEHVFLLAGECLPCSERKRQAQIRVEN